MFRTHRSHRGPTTPSRINKQARDEEHHLSVTEVLQWIAIGPLLPPPASNNLTSAHITQPSTGTAPVRHGRGYYARPVPQTTVNTSPENAPQNKGCPLPPGIKGCAYNLRATRTFPLPTQKTTPTYSKFATFCLRRQNRWLPVQALLGTASTGAVPAVFVLIFKGEGYFS
jgi:hypothetical protein